MKKSYIIPMVDVVFTNTEQIIAASLGSLDTSLGSGEITIGGETEEMDVREQIELEW